MDKTTLLIGSGTQDPSEGAPFQGEGSSLWEMQAGFHSLRSVQAQVERPDELVSASG